MLPPRPTKPRNTYYFTSLRCEYNCPAERGYDEQVGGFETSLVFGEPAFFIISLDKRIAIYCIIYSKWGLGLSWAPFFMGRFLGRSLKRHHSYNVIWFSLYQRLYSLFPYPIPIFQSDMLQGLQLGDR